MPSLPQLEGLGREFESLNIKMQDNFHFCLTPAAADLCIWPSPSSHAESADPIDKYIRVGVILVHDAVLLLRCYCDDVRPGHSSRRLVTSCVGCRCG